MNKCMNHLLAKRAALAPPALASCRASTQAQHV